MKNLHVAMLILGVSIAGSMIPIESSKAEGPFFITDCYHRADGVVDPLPYHSFIGSGTCPPITPASSGNNLNKHLPNYDPHLCEEVPVRGG